MNREELKELIRAEIKEELKKRKKNTDLSEFQKTVKLLNSYKMLKTRVDYLKNNLNNIQIKKKYSIGEIKATSNDNLSEIDKIEIIKEKRLKEIDLLNSLITNIEQGLDYIKNNKYCDVIHLFYFERLSLEDIATKFNVDTSTIKRNKSKMIFDITCCMFGDEIIKEIVSEK